MPSFVCHIDSEQSQKFDCLAFGVSGEPHLEMLSFLKNGAKKSGDIFLLPHRKTEEFLNLVARTGALRLGEKEIVIDLYGRGEVTYRVEPTEENEVRVLGWVTYKEQAYYLHECDFLGPHFFIKGHGLKRFETEATWSVLKRVYQKKASFEDIEDDDVEIQFVGNAKELVNVLSTPLPVLKLTDRTGAFANLFVENGKGELLDLDDLSWERDLLETDFLKKKVSSSEYYCPMDCVAKSLMFLLEIGWKVIDHQGRRVLRHTDVSVDFEENNRDVVIRGELKYDDHNVSLRDVVGAFNRKERFLNLSSNEVGLLSDSVTESIATPLLEEGFTVPKSRLMSLSSLLEQPVRVEPSLKELIQGLTAFDGLDTSPPSTAFLAQLRPYQQQGVNWLSFLYENQFHGLLADEMGLGKTVQVLAFLSRLTLTEPVLIVMPTSLVFHWKKEIERFLPSLNVAVYHGSDREKVLLDTPQIILTSYAVLRLDIPQLSQYDYQCVILDEAQMIKNAKTKSAQAACQLRARFRLSMTGTPIENSLSDLWSHFHFLMPELLGEESDFEAQSLAAASDERYLRNIKKKLRPFLLRRTKEEVAPDLPEKIEQIVWVEMEDTQRSLYESCLRGVQQRAKEGISKQRMEIFEAILRLRQICCHPLLCASLFPEDSIFSSAKISLLLEDISTLVAEKKKVLVYSQFTQLLKLIVQEISQEGWSYVYLDGATKNREEIVTTFQEDPEIPLFLISLKAGGVGLNLTAADYVLLVDPWWNEAVENQAIDRAHRIGRDQSVIAKRYITAESIEEKILKLKEKKRKLTHQWMEDTVALENLTDEDLRDLIF